MLTVRDDRVSPLVEVVPTAFDNVRLGVRGGSSGGMSLTSLSLSDNIRRRLSGVSLSETVTNTNSVFNYKIYDAIDSDIFNIKLLLLLTSRANSK